MILYSDSSKGPIHWRKASGNCYAKWCKPLHKVPLMVYLPIIVSRKYSLEIITLTLHSSVRPSVRLGLTAVWLTLFTLWPDMTSKDIKTKQSKQQQKTNTVLPHLGMSLECQTSRSGTPLPKLAIVVSDRWKMIQTWKIGSKFRTLPSMKRKKNVFFSLTWTQSSWHAVSLGKPWDYP